MIHSPICYPGGKRWLFKFVRSLLPPNTHEIVSPFFGGGAVELNLAIQGIKVYGGDVQPQLINFWEHYLKDGATLVSAAKTCLRTFKRHTLIEIRKNYVHANQFFDAVLFYLFSQLSYGGKVWHTYLTNYYTENGNIYRVSKIGRKTPVISKRATEIAKTLQGLPINLICEDFEAVLSEHPDTPAYLDPPYPHGDYLYKSSFDHERLAQILKARENWILSYSDCELVRELYKDYKCYEVVNTSGFRKEGKPLRQHELVIVG